MNWFEMSDIAYVWVCIYGLWAFCTVRKVERENRRLRRQSQHRRSTLLHIQSQLFPNHPEYSTWTPVLLNRIADVLKQHSTLDDLKRGD